MRNRLIATTAAVLAFACLAAGCSGSDSTSAATVNGTVVDNRAFTDDLKAFEDNKLFQAEQTAGEGVQSGASGTVSNEFARTTLFNEILFALVDQELDARNLDPASADPATVETQTLARFSANSDPAVFAAFPTSFQEKAKQDTAAVLTLQEAFIGTASTDAELQAEYDRDPRRYGKLCSSHILVATEDEAKAVLAQLEGGADFAELAKTTSTDTGSGANGGALTNPDGSCVPASTFVPEFVEGALTASGSQPTQPVRTQFGWHVITVDQWEIVPFADAKADVQTHLSRQGSQALNDWLTAALKGDIWVNPRYGTWDPNTTAILPPGQEPVTPTTAATATSEG